MGRDVLCAKQRRKIDPLWKIGIFEGGEDGFDAWSDSPFVLDGEASEGESQNTSKRDRRLHRTEDNSGSNDERYHDHEGVMR